MHRSQLTGNRAKELVLRGRVLEEVRDEHRGRPVEPRLVRQGFHSVADVFDRAPSGSAHVTPPFTVGMASWAVW